MTTTGSRFRLTEAEKAAFQRNGYLGPVRIYDEEDMTARWNTIRRQLNDRSHAIYSGEVAGSIANYDRHLDIDLLSEHIMKPEIVDRVASILGPDVLCWRSEFFPKFQGDEGTDWHQAATFGHASGTPQIVWPSVEKQPAFGGAITAWTAFTHSTKENGCLQLMPGTHTSMNYDESKGMAYDPAAINRRVKDDIKRGFYGYDYRRLQKDPDWKPDESQAFPLVMRPGECVIFWSTLMHASLPHTGAKKDYRMGFTARYVPTSVRIYPGTDGVAEYGGGIDLTEYGAVLVSGTDRYRHNRTVRRSRRGFTFSPHQP
ncbi:chlorinating enzyme [Actinocorallia sp. A-T 12471]|uniref:chlorinating enzyme n=1 Tax=Actinocorallia sp. A-T 12471 TaxID=3089813 RepID=UPI0029CFFC41|nr:chlorinating enzyme [Actinocorallia sp. A-T 12471]MDX6741527.1 chlorinating enzyme [Actinocorallia sp. A-T 12471]